MQTLPQKDFQVRIVIDFDIMLVGMNINRRTALCTLVVVCWNGRLKVWGAENVEVEELTHYRHIQKA